MSVKRSFRGAFGFGQMMASLLVVLPTIAFSTTFLIDYWAVMQSDHRLKLVAKVASQYYDSKINVSDVTDIDEKLLNLGTSLCPGGRSMVVTSSGENSAANLIDIKVQYTYNGTYFKNRNLSTNSITYSYHEQNLSVVLTCQ